MQWNSAATILHWQEENKKTSRAWKRNEALREWARQNFAAWSLKSEEDLDWLVNAARQDTGGIRTGVTILTVVVAVLAGGWLRVAMFPTRSDSAIDGGIVAGFAGMAGAYAGIKTENLILKHRLRKIAEFENRESSRQ